MWLFWICEAEPAAAQFHQCIVTNRCLFWQTFLIVSVSLCYRIMMKARTAAVTCEDIFHLNLRPELVLQLQQCYQSLHASACICPDTQLHLSVCRSDILSLILSVLEIKMCLAGMASRSLRNLLSFLSSCCTRTTSLTFAQEQCGSTGASTMWMHNLFPVFDMEPSLGCLILVLSTSARVII